jgi:DNA mismatch repair protein MutS
MSAAPPKPAKRRDIDAAPPVTPMMAQYLAIKRGHPDCLLFYRMGDFYELFFDDAVAAAATLDITLTRRGKHEGADIPMCGVPVHAADAYLSRLIRKGHRVAVCEQMEDPAAAKRRGARSVVAREVVRIVTPGTITEDALLDPGRHNFLAALAEAQGALGLAWLDISTGAFRARSLDAARLGAVLAGLEPGELLVADRLLARPDLADALAGRQAALTPLPAARFDSNAAQRRLADLFGVATTEGFGAFSRAEIAACGALVDYVDATQKGRRPRLEPPRRITAGATMEIDAATRRNLELVETLSGQREGALLAVVDHCVTGAGSRLLRGWLVAPLTEVGMIRARHDMVEAFREAPDQRRRVREILGRCPDVARALSRLTLGRGGPRDLAAVAAALAAAAALRLVLDGDDAAWPAGLRRCRDELGDHETLVARLNTALVADPPLQARDGGFINRGYSGRFDELCQLRDESRRLIMELQRRYGEETGINGLKIRHNNVLGYFVEVTAGHADRIPLGGEGPFFHRQTMASAVRFSTNELADLEGRIGRAADQALGLEIALFDELVAAVVGAAEPVALAAAAIATIDVVSALAELAALRRYVRPVVDDSRAFAITGGRHAVVEAALAARREQAFVANDCDLDVARRLWLLTGPNMAGKSTFLRQNALIAVLAQAGSFVPAEAARIGVVDRLFSRVGAADDLARGRSTFMVEMVETAAILNQAGERALVILDEIGRGTATFDGLSIAWATLEHLHGVNCCRALFATHFHELTALAARLDALNCHTMKVKEWEGEVVFLHEVEPGAADRSYGIHVARLAGLPAAVLARAEEVLHTLERGEQSGALTRLADDLPLFAAAVEPPAATASAVEALLGGISADGLSPREALDLVYRLKALLED